MSIDVPTSIFNRAVAHAGLNALIAGRCYPEIAPPNPVLPYVIYRKISTKPYRAMGNTIRKGYRYQFDSYALLKTDSSALDIQVCAAFDYYSGDAIAACLFDGESDDVSALNTNAQTRRTSSDFIITA